MEIISQEKIAQEQILIITVEYLNPVTVVSMLIGNCPVIICHELIYEKKRSIAGNRTNGHRFAWQQGYIS